jgi:hypothetical protein
LKIGIQVLRLSSKLTKAPAEAYIYKHSEKGQIKFIPRISKQGHILANSPDPRNFSLYQDVFLHLPVNETVSGQDTKLTMSAKNEYLKKINSNEISTLIVYKGKSEWDVVKGIIHFIMMSASLEIDMPAF